MTLTRIVQAAKSRRQDILNRWCHERASAHSRARGAALLDLLLQSIATRVDPAHLRNRIDALITRGEGPPWEATAELCRDVYLIHRALCESLVQELGDSTPIETSAAHDLHEKIEALLRESIEAHLERSRLLQRMLEHLDWAVWVIDAQGHVRYTNHVGRQWLGAGDHLHDWLGRFATLEGERLPLAELPPVRALAGQLAREARIALSQPGAERRILETSAFPIPLGEGVPGVVWTAHDITERHTVETLRDRFMGVLSHDLRTPLASIRLSAQLLKGGARGQAESIGLRISTSVERMQRMIDELLDVVRGHSPQGLPLRLARAHLGLIAQRALDEVQVVVHDHGFRLETHGDLEGQWDSDRLQQALGNLVGNAVAYSPPNTVVTISASSRGDLVELSVTDQGVGIPPERRGEIFQPFNRAGRDEEHATAVTSSLGLGLYIVAAIARAHGGHVEVESTPGQGSTFRMVLPRVPRSNLEGVPAHP